MRKILKVLLAEVFFIILIVFLVVFGSDMFLVKVETSSKGYVIGDDIIRDIKVHIDTGAQIYQEQDMILALSRYRMDTRPVIFSENILINRVNHTWPFWRQGIEICIWLKKIVLSI